MKTPAQGLFLLLLSTIGLAQQVTGQDLDKILDRADKLLEEAKGAYEEAREKSSVSLFIEAGFKLEDARIKYIVLQEIGSPEKQKTAADRLRSVNQLAKLIHDGKVAVSGSSAVDAPPITPQPAPKSGEPPPPPTPVKASVDVSKRATVPDAAKFKDAEKLIKDLYKEQYAKKTQADRKALGRQLLSEVPKNRNDQMVVWVLCREAQEQAVQGCDLPTAMKAIDAAAEVFDIDGMAMRNAALAATSKTAKTPEESAGVVAASFKSIDELVANDQYDAADKLAQSMMPLAKKAGNVLVYTQLANRAKDVADIKGLYQGMKSVLETLAKNPEDPAANSEMGKFLCFVKGSWDLGLRFLAKGADPTLKGLAEKEIANPTSSSELVAIADSWYELGDKEKSGLKKTQEQSHAKTLYEAALADSTGLLRTKILKRLAESEAKLPEKGINLFALLDPAKDQVRGSWRLDGPELFSPPNEPAARIQIPYIVPEEYDLTAVVAKKAGGTYGMGLPFGEAQFVVAYSPSGEVTITDGGQLNEKLKAPPVSEDKPFTVMFSVRKSSVTVTVNGKPGESWKADYSKVSLHPNWHVPSKRSPFIFTWASSYSITKLFLVAVTGQGKNLR